MMAKLGEERKDRGADGKALPRRTTPSEEKREW